MPQDAFTLKYLCEELNILFKGGKVNKIVQPNNEQVILTVYTGKKTEKLLLDVNPAHPRIGVTEAQFESPLTAPNFCMLVRKHLLNATIEHISLVGFDRVVKIEFSPSNEYFDSAKKVLYVELMGRYSNIILTEENKVLGGNRGVNFFDNGVRPLIVNKEYVLPPSFNKKHPEDEGIKDIFNGVTGDFAKAVLDNVQGIAVSTAKEIERVILDRKKTALLSEDFSKTAHEVLKDFIYSSCPNPAVLMEGETAKDVFVFPYKTITGEYKFFDKLYLAEEYCFANKLLAKSTGELRTRLNAITSSQLKKIKKKISIISSRLSEAKGLEENRIKGELLLANIYKIEKGASKVVLENYYDQSEIEIELDSNFSVSKNAENYYKKYNKQKRALNILSEQLDEIKKEEEYLESLLTMISLSKDIEELLIVKEELLENGLLKEKKLTKKTKNQVKGYREYSYKGFTIKVGRNNIENDMLCYKASKTDIWLHVKDYPSSHVIIEKGNREISNEIITFASEICAYYSKVSNEDRVEVIYTERKNVKKPPKAKPGKVIYSEYNSVVVSPNERQEFRV